MTTVRDLTMTINGVEFEIILWVDESKEIADIEATALAESQYLVYPGSSLVDIFVSVDNMPLSEWESIFSENAEKQLALA